MLSVRWSMGLRLARVQVTRDTGDQADAGQMMVHVGFDSETDALAWLCEGFDPDPPSPAQPRVETPS